MPGRMPGRMPGCSETGGEKVKSEVGKGMGVKRVEMRVQGR